MDTNIVVAQGAPSPGLAWTQAAFVGQIKEIFSGSFLSICKVDAVVDGLAPFRKTLGLPEHDGRKLVEYQGLRLLHCTQFATMPQAVRLGIPHVLVAVFGLTEQHAPALLGPTGWTALQAVFEVWCEPQTV